MDDECSHEIKRHLLLGRKALTNLDSILKSRDITFPTKFHIVKDIVFPVFMYRCELDNKKGWAPKNWCLQTVVLEKTLKSPWTARRSYQSILKEINPEYSLEGLTLKVKLQYFGHQMRRTDSLGKTLMLGKIEGRRRRGWQRMRWLDGITDSMDMSLSKLGVGEGQGGLECCSPWGRKESDMTLWLNNKVSPSSFIPPLQLYEVALTACRIRVWISFVVPFLSLLQTCE